MSNDDNVYVSCIKSLQESCRHPEVEVHHSVEHGADVPICMCCGKVLETKGEADGQTN